MSTKKCFSMLLAFAFIVSLLPAVTQPAIAALAVDCTVTDSEGEFYVNNAGGYTTLAEAFTYCADSNSDGTLVIQMGNGSASLQITESENYTTYSLPAATYTGKVNIINDTSKSYGYGLSVVSGTVTFDGLEITTDVASQSSFSAVYIADEATLNIAGTTSISVGAADDGLFNLGTVNVSGGTISASGNSSAAIINRKLFTMTNGTITAAGGTAICIKPAGTPSSTTVSGGSITAIGASCCGIDGIGTVNIYANANITSAYFAVIQRGGSLTVSGGTIETTSLFNSAISLYNGSSASITGGVVKATNTDASAAGAGINVFDSTLFVSGDAEIDSTCEIGQGIFADGSNTTIDVSGNAKVSGVSYGILNNAKTATGNGSVYIHGGEIKATGSNSFGMRNARDGTITIENGSSIISSYGGVENYNSGIINMKGGAVTAPIYGIYVKEGTANISGGTVTAESTSGLAGIAVCDTNFTDSPALNLTGSATVISKCDNTVSLGKFSGSGSENVSFYGSKTIYGSNTGSISVKGAVSGANYEINSSNYGSAIVSAFDINTDISFLAWTSDAGLSTKISEENGETFSNLADNTYLKAGSCAAVKLAAGSLGHADNRAITGLTYGMTYKVTIDSTVYYSTANGNLTTDLAASSPLAGTSINSLTNGTTYMVEEYVWNTVRLIHGSLGQAGNACITGLTAGTKYKVMFHSTAYYVTTGGNGLSDDPSDAVVLSGTEITNLTNGEYYYVEAYTPHVKLTASSLGTEGDACITGLTSGARYRVLVQGTTYFVSADGTLLLSSSDLGALSGTAITGLDNDETYLVEVYSPSVILYPHSLGNAGDGRITGLPHAQIVVIVSHSYTAIQEGALSVYYVTADGALSANSADVGTYTGETISGLTNNTIYVVMDYQTASSHFMSRIFLSLDSLGAVEEPFTAVSNLTPGTRYKITMDSTAYYTKADGTVTSDPLQAAALTGTEITGLPYGCTYKVEVYSTGVTLASGSLGTAGEAKITGLSSGTKYKVTVGTTTYYVKADGTLSSNSSDAAELIGTEITGLTNGTSYKVEIYSASGGTGGTGGTGGSPATTPMTSKTASVVVGGKTLTVGTVNTVSQNGKTITTVTISTDKLEAMLEGSSGNTTVTLPITNGSDTVAGKLDGQAIKSMEDKSATLIVKTDSASYSLPASEISIDAVSDEFGENVSLRDITVSVSISEPSDAMLKVVENAASDGGYTIQVPAVEFTVNCTYGGQTVAVNTFNSYVERLIAIPDGVDASKITTAIVVEPDGSSHHVPTEVTVIDGKYYAKINSLTNSTYSIIYNPVTFSDVENHWAKNAINDMGSRLVVTGVGNNNYTPDRGITRAEFAAIIVRALGLEPGVGTNGFRDVAATDWYCGYVESAAAYGIVNGYGNGSFCPNDKITREQAMAMTARAMKITGLKADLTDSEVSSLLSAYTDASSVQNYAKESIAACLKTGITNGTRVNKLSPKAYVTRAEVAVMAQRLLQKSKLI